MSWHRTGIHAYMDLEYRAALLLFKLHVDYLLLLTYIVLFDTPSCIMPQLDISTEIGN